MKTKGLSAILVVCAVCLLIPAPSPAAINVTAKIKVPLQKSVFDRVATTTNTYFLKNSSTATFTGPFRVVVESLNNRDVAVVNPDGYTKDGKPYFEYTKSSLRPNETTAVKAWNFQQRCGRRVSATVKPFNSAWQIAFQPPCSPLVTVYVSVYSSEVGANRTPVADAGPDQTVKARKVIALDGSLSTDEDGDPLTYLWSVVSKPAGSRVTLTNKTSVKPTVKLSMAGTYVLGLTVNDGGLTSARDTCTLSTSNSRPVAEAGPDQTVELGTVRLDGSRSTDVDGNRLTYAWSIVSMPPSSTAALSSPSAVRPSFMADRQGEYVLQLVVSHGTKKSFPEFCRISTVNSQPRASAGADQKVTVRATVHLDGVRSTDVDGDALTYRWAILAKPAGSTAAIAEPTSVRPTFMADAPGTYVAQLIVNDGHRDSVPDTVIVTTEGVRPVADAGRDQTVAGLDTVTLDGTGSTDADGDALTWKWAFLSVPKGSVAKLSSATAKGPTFTADKAGTYVVQLQVNDGVLKSAPDTVVIDTEDSRPVAAAGADQDVFTNQTVHLDASGSTDPDADLLAHFWAMLLKPAGSSAELSNAYVLAPEFLADFPGTYVLQLIVRDEVFASQPDTVAVTASVRMVSVPDVLGMAQPDAEATMTAGLLTANPITTAYSDDVIAGSVISQDPPGGASVAEGSAIALVVSLGPQPITVPDVVGLTQAEAEAAITGAMLTVGVITTAYSDDVLAGITMSQSPAAATSVAKGSAVSLTVSLGPEPLPPDPQTVAPQLDSTVSTTVAASSEFLYTGPDPIQRGVAPGTIEQRRAAVLRGKVLDREGNPLVGVRVTILNHPEYGHTLTRLDGMFDMVVNGGGPLAVDYRKHGYLTAQRREDIPWQDYMWFPEVRMVQADPKVNLVDLAAPGDFRVVRGSLITDERGQRRSTVLIPGGTQAWMVFPDGHEEPLASFTVRATEYTVGPSGPETMPAELPPTSAYTYCEEFTVEEAVAAGAPEVRFSQPVIAYNENFLDFPVGTGIPLGNYNRERGVWIPSDNGTVIKIVSITAGLAELDTDGDATIDNGVSLGITDAERATLATLYQADQTLWRVLVPHFTTPWDKNMGVTCEEPCNEPKVPQARQDEVDGDCEKKGSIIQCRNQVLGQTVEVTGTPFRLSYKSDRVPGRADASTLDLSLSSPMMSPTLKKITLKASIAGQEIERSFRKTDFDLSNLSDSLGWDGKDAYGRSVQGRQQVSLGIGYGYRLVYGTTDRFGYNGNGVQITTSQDLMFTIWQTQKSWMGIWDARGQGLGGWTLDIHHGYDPQQRVIYYGDGSKRSASGIGRIIRTVAGGGPYGNNGPAIQAAFYQPQKVVVAPDGSYYVSDYASVRRVDTDGIITTVAGRYYSSPTGSPQTGYSGDGGPASEALLNGPGDLAIGPDGSLYIADTGNFRIRRVGPDGIITTFAGNGSCPSCEYNCPPIEDVPATEAPICGVGSMSFGPDGSLYLIHNIGSYKFIRRVGPDGIMTKVAGSYGPCNMTEGARAKDVGFQAGPIAVGPDGSVYVGAIATGCGSGTPPNIWRIGVDGMVKRVAGNWTWGCAGGDGGPAKDASMDFPSRLAVDPDGSLYAAMGWCESVRVITPDGLINTIVGGKGGYGFGGDNGLATQATFFSVSSATPGPDRDLYITDLHNGRVRRIAPLLRGVSDGDVLVPSEDGAEVYLFDSRGKHLRTYNALTAAVKYEFGYSAAGLLISVSDGDGNVTTIERDGEGRPLAIVSPYGQRTTMTLDDNGYLTGITNPAAESAGFSYTADGLMTGFIDPRGGLYQFTYDARGRFTGETDPAGGSQTLSLTRNWTSFEVSHTTGMNRTTDYLVEFLGTGAEHSVNTFPSGIVTDSLLKKNDGNERVTLPDGTIATYQLGPDPRFGMQAPLPNSQTVTMPSGLTATATTTRTATLSTPDNPLALSTLRNELTINGRKYTSDYTASTKTLVETSPAGRQATSRMDTQGRTVEYQVAGVLPFQFTYDAQGRLTNARQGSGPDLRESTFEYDAEGYLQTVTDPLLQTMSFGYDQAGRVIREVLPDGRETTYGYDAGGNLTSLTPPGRPSHAFKHTPADLTAEYIPPDIGIGTVKTRYSHNTDRQLTGVLRPDGLAIDFVYDPGGRLSQVTYPGGPVTFTYDPGKGQLSQVSSPDGNTLTYAYDGALVTGETWAGAVTGSVSRTYDNNFRVTGIGVNGGNATAYQYDNDSLLTKAGDLTLSRNAQTGLLTGSTLGNVTDAWTYNSFGEAVGYVAKNGTTEIFRQQFTYDRIGRIVQKIETVEGTADTYDYLYDLAGRLTEVKKNGVAVGAYTYDANDNRLSYTGAGGTVNGTYDDQDRLMQYGTATYAYTANGELQSRTAGGSTTLYGYDVFGNLKSVTLPGGTLIEYAVDGRNRRLGKKVNGGWVRKFLYLDQLRPAAELDASDAVVSLFIYGSRFIVPDYMVKGAVTYRIISDHLGSPRLVVNTATGDIVQRLDYDEFGNVVSDTNPGFQPFGFAGGLYDPETKLVRFGARDYEAGVGRWTTKDPSLFDGVRANLFSYAFNDPINWVDDTGLEPYGNERFDKRQICRNKCSAHRRVQPGCRDEPTVFQGGGEEAERKCVAQCEGDITDVPKPPLAKPGWVFILWNLYKKYLKYMGI